MGSTRRGWAGALFAAALLVALGNRLYPQSAASSGQLGTEIQRLEQRLSQAGISPAERHDASVRLARLLQLSGNIAGAAAGWLDAAAASPQDDAALVAGAYCLAAVGEWERSLQTLSPLIASGRRGQPLLQARYLDACLRARISGNVSALGGLAQDQEFAGLHPLIYYTLWRIIAENPGIFTEGGAESWRSRLVAEFPNSPEARAANPEKTGALVSAAQNPVWMLFPGAGDPSPVAPAVSVAANSPGASPSVPSAAAPSATPAPNATPASTAVLQTGAFSREANARGQAEALRNAGFPATVSRKIVNNAEHWAVTVPAGQDASRTREALKRAGFDSFPVRNN
ncbi:MAG: SPOR domain-containing protein [Treponema sp.]|jgi:cell division septation protein DedD|nr:SPOR domain-containing protein [Treponema sp.]